MCVYRGVTCVTYTSNQLHVHLDYDDIFFLIEITSIYMNSILSYFLIYAQL